MAPKKQIKSLAKKGVSTRKAAQVKGGRNKLPRIALNHNLAVL